mmetsp:Transcript_18544/g.31059  ORF Transcript_18544/g.31059 Transcript_18544/m.31059 type:complete len:81 (+) Transcript_18544:3268-3510(+)
MVFMLFGWSEIIFRTSSGDIISNTSSAGRTVFHISSQKSWSDGSMSLTKIFPTMFEKVDLLEDPPIVQTRESYSTVEVRG